MNLKKYQTQIASSNSSSELETLRIKLLGRKGLINQLFSEIKNQQPDNRQQYGQKLNKLKSQLQNLIKKQALKIAKQNEIPKQTKITNSIFALPKIGHLHPITTTENQINSLFKKLGFSIYDGPEIETDEYCFERLNLAKNHPARELQDSIFIKEPEILLRTQTSSIEARLLSQEKPPFKTAFPGRVYRNEKVNKSNHFIFNQYQAVVIKKNITLKDLFGTMDLMFKTLYGTNVTVRYRPKYYPEVEPGVGPDMQCFNCTGKGCSICKGAGWVEMGGAGIIHPAVLQKANIDPKKWSGFAFGMGLDRWTMAKYNIKDIRTFSGGNLTYLPNK